MGEVSSGAPLVVAVDGGGSKTDAVALEFDGTVVARASGPGSSPHFEGLEDSVSTIDALVREVAGGRPVAHAAVYLAGPESGFLTGANLPLDGGGSAARGAVLG